MDSTYFDNRQPNKVTFDRQVFVDQAGYFVDSEKRAVFTIPCKSFQILNVKEEVQFEGDVVHFGPDQTSGDDIYLADFSSFQQIGTYVIQSDNGQTSLHFSIGPNVYDHIYHDIMKAYYFLRCGKRLEAKYAGPFTHDKCHTQPAYLWEKFVSTSDSSSLTKYDVSGGWHDAGDYGRYVTAGACALSHLLYAYKMYPDKIGKRDLNIPESGNGMPDILSECRIELDWIMKMQRADGGAYHKATTMVHAPFVMPEMDQAQMLIFPVSSIATADLAGICALASSIYKDFDKAYADQLLQAAVSSGKWLVQNPSYLGFRNPDGCNTGEYGEQDDVDNRFWAFSELYNATGEEQYLTIIHELLTKSFSLTSFGYNDMGGLGSLALLLTKKPFDESVRLRLKEEFLKAAQEHAALSDQCGYGTAMREEYYVWGSNLVLLELGMLFSVADYLEGKGNYRRYAERQLHYLLGVNATGYCYVSGNGEFCIKNPHLRPAFADGIEECIPGMVSGGPNRHPADPDAKILIPKGTPAMKCFADDLGCYSLNEITIYWNSPAVFLLTSLY